MKSARDSWIIEGGADLLAVRTVAAARSGLRRPQGAQRRAPRLLDAGGEAGGGRHRARRAPRQLRLRRGLRAGRREGQRRRFLRFHPGADRTPTAPRAKSTAATGWPRSTGRSGRPALSKSIGGLLDNGSPRSERGARRPAAGAPASPSPSTPRECRSCEADLRDGADRARPEHIDELGHVNNAVWVQWIRSWSRSPIGAPSPTRRTRTIMSGSSCGTRSTISAPCFEGERITARTWVGEPKGARFDRHMEFVGEDGKSRVRVAHRLGDHRQGQRPADPRSAGGGDAVS